MASIYCSNCGKLIPVNSNFCKFCGAAQHGKQAASFHATEEPVDVLAIDKPFVTGSIQTITKSYLSPKVIWIFYLGNIAKSSVLIPLLIAGAFFYPIIFLPILCLSLLFMVIVAELTYKNYTYQVTDDGLQVNMGVIFKKQVSIPFGQIENVNIEQSAIDRILKIARINIETAGSTSGSVKETVGNYSSRSEAFIPGVDMSSAKKIHDVLIDGASAQD